MTKQVENKRWLLRHCQQNGSRYQVLSKKTAKDEYYSTMAATMKREK